MGIEFVGSGSYLPENLVTNIDLFPLIKHFDYDRAVISVEKKGADVLSMSEAEVFDVWVQQVSGIKQRYMATTDLKNSEYGAAETMGYYAAKDAIENSAIDKNFIDSIIFTTYTPSKIIPNGSVAIGHLLGLKNINGFTMNTACSGFMDALGEAYLRILSGFCNTVLVVAADYMSGNIDYGDSTTAILFADGASAAILQKKESKNGVLAYYSCHDYSPEHISMQYGKPIRMGGGPNVQKRAVNAMSSALNTALNKSNKTLSDLSVVIAHQANIRIINKLAEKIGADDGRMAITIDKVGNISCATTGYTLDAYLKNKLPVKYKKGESLIGITAVGGGYTFGSVIIQA